MKKVLLNLLALLIFSGIAFAQDSPDKAFKSAKSTFSKAKVETDNAAKKEKMKEAVESIEIAASGIDQLDEKEHAKVWLMMGDIYTELVQADVNMIYLDPDHQIEFPEGALKSFKAYKKALDKASKKYETKDALTGIEASATLLSTVGNGYLNKKEFDKAYLPLNTVVEIRELLRKNDVDAVLSDEKALHDHLFVVGFCALSADNTDRALEVFKTLIDANYEEPRIYAQVFNLTLPSNEEEALKYLNMGREKYPDDTEVLFAEINYLIQKQEFENLKIKLTEAMDKAPDNPSVPSALGNVYMNLFQKEYDAGNMEKANEYFADSKKYYERALNIDPKLFDAIYSLGSLYYNKAVGVSKAMQKLGNTKDELKKYDLLMVEMKGYFNDALPYFKKAEKMNPNDSNTLIALKEIFARNDDFTTSNEFKKRLETVQSGGKVDSPFFND